MPATARRRRGRGATPTTVWAAIAATLLVHGTVLGSVEALDLGVVGHGVWNRAAGGEGTLAATELRSNCVGDGLLASSARMSLCFAPWRDDTDQCLYDARMAMYMDLSSCVHVDDEVEVAAISMVPSRALDKVTPIDPEPLLEMMKEQEEQPKPPPPPELAQQQQPQPPPPPPPPPPRRNTQVVETARPTEEKPPEDTRFLAEYNTAVKKQTVARGAVDEPMVAKSKPSELTPKENPKEASVKEQQPDRPRGTNKDAPDVPGTLAMRKEGAQHPSDTQQDQKTRGSSIGATGPIAFDGFTPKRGTGAFEQERRERSELPRGQAGAGGGAPEVPNLKPSQEMLERAIGGGSVDHLEDVSEGDETALNAKQWVHASFFNRMKRQVRQNWDPESVWRRRDPSGQIYGLKTRTTEVRVSLTTKGELAKIVVVSPSGMSELDDEAVRAFRAAAPFVNAPKELAGDDGLITFTFSFVFEISGSRTSWRVFRSM